MGNSTINTEATRAIYYKQLIVTSPVFKENEMIPAKYTCDGVNVSLPLDIKHISEEAKCLALIVEDPDAPIGIWVHWVVWNIPVTHHIKENDVHGIEVSMIFSSSIIAAPALHQAHTVISLRYML